MANRIGEVPTVTLRGRRLRRAARALAWKSSRCPLAEAPRESPPEPPVRVISLVVSLSPGEWNSLSGRASRRGRSAIVADGVHCDPLEWVLAICFCNSRRVCGRFEGIGVYRIFYFFFYFKVSLVRRRVSSPFGYQLHPEATVGPVHCKDAPLSDPRAG